MNKTEFDLIRTILASIFAAPLIANKTGQLDLKVRDNCLSMGFSLADVMLKDFRKEVEEDGKKPGNKN